MSKKHKYPPRRDLVALWDAVVAHVEKYEVSCAEAIYQMDSVNESLPEFAEAVFDIVGYAKDEEDE